MATIVPKIVVTMGLQKGDSSMDDTVEVTASGIKEIPERPDHIPGGYGEERGVIATFAEPDTIDWEWLRVVSDKEGAYIVVRFAGPIVQ